MEWHAIDTWIVLTGIVCAMACAVVGSFLVLRQMSMMGDAISHAALPGLAIAFLVTGGRASVSMFMGAVMVGVLTAVFTQWISYFGNVDRGASMGIVFTTLFAVGLLLIVQAADRVDLDPGCVLYGAIELTPLDVLWNVRWGDVSIGIPRAFVVLTGVLALNLLFVILFFKELRLSSFDPALATTLGFSAKIMHYLLMTMVAITTVASFEAVGSIIVIAMLVVPGATAHLLTDRLITMVGLSMVVAAFCAVVGHIAALTVPTWFGFADTSTSGMMSVVAGLSFLLTAVLAPRYGLIARRLNMRAKGA
ncbi:MAG: Manganese transport system membrane protein MntB [Verrucomicrobia subdivision 3 bacterium]|nr:Manganese transport system membrane protein MntB [Limisphaerales bacterium]MCS1417027.1 Manganese transport system membrane protein MntB [Limisphaerales bacterium]